MSRIDSLMDLIGLGIKKTQPDPVTGTVSKLDEAILNMRQNKMQANQVENALMGMKGAGVKRAEIQETGLDRFLAQQQGSVTQEDIARYLDQQREPIGLQRYETAQYKPLESIPPLQATFSDGFGGIDRQSIARSYKTTDALRSDDPEVLMPALRDYQDWVVSRGGTPNQANYLAEKFKYAHSSNLPAEGQPGGKFDIHAFATARGYHDAAFENPTMGLDFVEPVSGRRYVVEPTGDRSLYRTYEHMGNERVPLKLDPPIHDPHSGLPPSTEQRFPTNMDEALRAINKRRVGGTDTTRYSHMTDPGLDRTSYKEDVFTLPSRDADDVTSGYEHEQHWPDVENPLVHLRSSHRELDDGGFSVHLEELQSDWHQQARQAGGYGGNETTNRLMDSAIDASEKANRKITDLIKGKGTIETDDIEMVSGFDSRVYYTNEFGDQYRLAEVQIDSDGDKTFNVFDENIKKAFPDGAPDELEDLLEDAADKQLGVRKIREAPYSPPHAPLKDDEWVWFGVKQAIKRAIDEGANGITLPNSADMIIKEKATGHAKTENMLRTMYDQKIPSVLKKIGKQYGVKPEVRTMYYGDQEVERTFLPLTDEMIEKIMSEGMKKYGKQDAPRGILDSLGDMYA